MADYQDVLERELERLSPSRIPIDRLARRRERKRRRERIGAAIVAVTVSALAVAGLSRAFELREDTGDELPIPPAADLSFVDLATGEATPLPESIRTFRSVGSIQVSPDGRSLAFEAAPARGSLPQIYVSNLDGSDARQLTHDEGIEAARPRWSPDGSKIVFEGSTADGLDLFVVDVGTGRTTRLTVGLAVGPLPIGLMPSFSADGGTILYTRVAPGSVGLWTIPTTGGESFRLHGGALGSFSPDGTRVAFRRATVEATVLGLGEVQVADVDGTDPRTLHGSGIQMRAFIFWDQSEVNASAPMWSRDGSRLLVLDHSSKYGPVRVRVIDVSTGEATRVGRAQEASWFDNDTLIVRGYRPQPRDEGEPVVEEGDLETAAAFFVDSTTGDPHPIPTSIVSFDAIRDVQASADGRRIAFAAKNGSEPFQIWVANSDGSGLQRITNGDSASFPRWSPDSSKIVFESRWVFIVDIATEQTTQLTFGSYRTTRPSFSADGSTVLYTREASHRLDLWTVPAVGGPSRLLVANGAWGSYSPDGSTIAYRRTGDDRSGDWFIIEDVSFVSAEGSPTQEPAGGGTMPFPGMIPDPPTWSPDGTRVAWAEDWAGAGTLYVLNRRTGRTHRLGIGVQPSWVDNDTLLVGLYERS